MIIRNTDNVLIHGITGKQGTFWTERMQEYGTRICGGVNPKRAGETQCGVPVYASAKAAMRAEPYQISVLFVPPAGCKDAALDAIEAGATGVVILTEHIPVHDVLEILATATANGARVLGPNTAGQVTPGECFAGFMPAWEQALFCPGNIGVVSRSGSLGALLCLHLVTSGFGQSAFIGIGGDPMIGTTQLDALRLFEEDPRTKAVVMAGEIGGSMEEAAAEYAAQMTKPVIAFIAGATAPPGRKMGHAGALVSGGQGSCASKRAALEKAGVVVLDTPGQLHRALQGLKI